MKVTNSISLSVLSAIAILFSPAINPQNARAQWVADVTPHHRNVEASSSISGTFQTPGEAAIDISSVRIFLNGREVTADSTINRSFFSYRPSQPLASGEHIVRVQFKNQEGLSNEIGWSFFVPTTSTTTATSTTTETETDTETDTETETEMAAAAVLPLNFISHEDGETIATQGFTLEGETKPGTELTVKVISSPPSVLGVINIGGETTLVNRSIVVDENGRFQVSVPRPTILQSGLRYTVEASANGPNGRSRTMQMNLVQQ